MHPKGQYVLAPGDRVALVQAGGGGFGDPAARPRAAILEDLAQGYVTPEGIARDYGIRLERGEAAE